MTTHWIDSLTRLTNEALLARVHDLAHRERRATVALIGHLAELDERRLYLDEGCSSLFTYCTEVLHYSEHAAYNRIECARAARRFPLLLDRLANGSLHLTAVRLLAPHLTLANHVELLDRARHLAKRRVEELIASIRPLPDVATMVTRLPRTGEGGNSPVASVSPTAEASLFDGSEAQSLSSNIHSDFGLAAGIVPVTEVTPAHGVDPAAMATSDPGVDPATMATSDPGADPAAVANSADRPAPAAPGRTTVIAPLSPGRFRIQFTADREMHENLMTARELLRHQIPNGDAAAVMKVALKLLVTELRRRKFAQTDRPRRAPSPDSNSRHIPAVVRREVVRREGDQCAFRGRDGRRCSARGPLEFHHLEPFAIGGRATFDNISLRCRAHNSLEATRCFGHRQLVPEQLGRLAGPGSQPRQDG